MKINAGMAINKILSKLNDIGIRTAMHKTDMVILEERRTLKTLKIVIGCKVIESKGNIKYMGINIDRNARMTAYARIIHEGTYKKFSTYLSIMPNIEGPKLRKRRVLALATFSWVLYAANIWYSENEWTEPTTLPESHRRISDPYLP